MNQDGASDSFAGMTTNERLFSRGILDAFNDAFEAKERESMIELLMRADFSRGDAEWIADMKLKQHGLEPL